MRTRLAIFLACAALILGANQLFAASDITSGAGGWPAVISCSGCTPVPVPTPQPTYAYTPPTPQPTYAYTAPTPVGSAVPFLTPTPANTAVSTATAVPAPTPILGGFSTLSAMTNWVQFPLSNCGGTAAGSYTAIVMPNVPTAETWVVSAVSAVFSTLSTSGTLTVTLDTGTQAPGAGTAQLQSTMSLSGTANTVVNGTVLVTPTNIAAGNRLAFKTAGTLTGLAGCTATIALKRTA